MAAYILMGVEPELDTDYPLGALQSLEQAPLVIAISSFKNEAMNRYADILLPMTTFAETPGTYVNVAGTWQHMEPAILPLGESKAGWEIIAQMAVLRGFSDFNYSHISLVNQEIKTKVTTQIENENHSSTDLMQLLAQFEFKADNQLTRLMAPGIYASDALVRHAPALQATVNKKNLSIRISPHLATQLNLIDGHLVTAKQGKTQVVLPLYIDADVADNQVLIPSNTPITSEFGEEFSPIQLQQEDNCG